MGSGEDRIWWPKPSGLVRSGCRAIARDPAGELPLGGPDSGASAYLPAPHSPFWLKRQGQASLTLHGIQVEIGMDGTEDNALESGSCC